MCYDIMSTLLRDSSDDVHKIDNGSFHFADQPMHEKLSNRCETAEKNNAGKDSFLDAVGLRPHRRWRVRSLTTGRLLLMADYLATSRYPSARPRSYQLLIAMGIVLPGRSP